jgi:CDP-glucose 4,6-dehydratase
MEWAHKNVFITGADGFIGGWLAKTLVEKGAHVIVLMRDTKVRTSLDIHQIRDHVTIIYGDILDFSLMQRIINEHEIEYCFHLAAQAIVQTANRSPISTFETNIKGTWTLLEAIRVTNSPHFKAIVIASSDKAYGKAEQLPYDERHPLNGLYPYDASKACADILARSYAVTYGLPVVVTRKANVYGGGDLNFSRIVPDTIRSLILGKELIIRSDGTPERDYIYVKDAVRGYLMLAEHIDQVKGEAFNFGTERPISVLALFRKIISLYGKDIEPKVLGTATGEIDRQYLSRRKIESVIGWKPEYSLEEGLKETIEWYKQYWRGEEK